MKEYPILFSPPMVRAIRAGRKFVTRRLDPAWLVKAKAGNRLWVKEGWRPTIAHSHGLNECDCGDVNVHYFADGEDRFFNDGAIPDEWTIPKAAAKGQVTSLFMPRWAAREVLECEEDARVERLQDITEEDAVAEGVPHFEETEAVGRFVILWSTLHTKPGERWGDNPEVVRVGRFRRIE